MMNFSELYDIKCMIGRTLFLGCHDWEKRIQMTVGASGKLRYVRFTANLMFTDKQITINICNNNTIKICGLISNALKLKHEDIVSTISMIQNELITHTKGEI